MQPAPGGGQARSPVEVPPRGWWAVLLRVWEKLAENHMAVVAAGCAFYAMLALFPAVSALVSIYGLFADPDAIDRQLRAAQGVMPEEAIGLIAGQARAVASGGAGLLGWSAAIGIAVALLSASRGAKTLFTALDITYEEPETRGFLRFNATAIAMTLAAIAGTIVGLTVILGLPTLLRYLDLAPLAGWGVWAASWVVLLTLVGSGVAVLYRFGPDRAAPRLRWVTPGSLLATGLWVLASIAFSWFASRFGSFNRTYGSLGGSVILLLWLYLSAWAILLGAQLNAELEKQTGHDTTTGPAAPQGRRDARTADHTASGRHG